MKCSVRTGPLSIKQEVLFEPEDIPKRPEGLSITETVICLQKGNLSRIAIPVSNESDHAITLNPHIVLGQLQQVKATYPVDIRPVQAKDPTVSTAGSETKASASDAKVSTARNRNTVEQGLWDPPVSVDHLTADQQENVKQMLREECATF